MNYTDKSTYDGTNLSSISTAVTTQALTSTANSTVIFSTQNQDSKSRRDPDSSENITTSTSANSLNILSAVTGDGHEAALNAFDNDLIKEEIEIKDELMMDNNFPLHNLPKVVSPPRLTVHGSPMKPPPMITPAPRPTIHQPPHTSRLPQLHIPQQPVMSAPGPRLSVIPPPPPLLKIPNILTNQHHNHQELPSISTGPSKMSYHQTPIQAQFAGGGLSPLPPIRTGQMGMGHSPSKAMSTGHSPSNTMGTGHSPSNGMGNGHSAMGLMRTVSCPSQSHGQMGMGLGQGQGYSSLSPVPEAQSELRSHLIGLLQSPPSRPGPSPMAVRSPPGTSSSSSSLPLTLPNSVNVISPSVSTSTISISDESSDNGSKGWESNAAKCKEYRERNKMKRRQVEVDYHRELKKNEKLNSIYNKQKYNIKRLKKYYLQCLTENKFQCSKKKNEETPSKEANKGDEFDPPMLTIKSEIQLNADVLIKEEDSF